MTDLIENLLELSPEGANVVINGKLVRGEMTPALASVLDLKSRFDEAGEDLTDDEAKRITAEWRRDWPEVMQDDNFAAA